jgi:hypothetical protein
MLLGSDKKTSRKHEPAWACDDRCKMGTGTRPIPNCIGKAMRIARQERVPFRAQALSIHAILGPLVEIEVQHAHFLCQGYAERSLASSRRTQKEKDQLSHDLMSQANDQVQLPYQLERLNTSETRNASQVG